MPEVSKLPPLDGFVSQLLGDLLAEAAEGHRPAHRQVRGFVLFADIVASTTMTDRVVASGPDGAELLGSVLSAYFGDVIRIVAEHGGDVVRIDGDAVIALWREDSLSEAPHLQAARAALALRDLRHWWPARSAALRHRLTLAAGTFSPVILSGAGKRSFLVLAGQALKTVGAIAHCGVPGEVVIDGTMVRLLGPSAVVRRVAGDAGKVHGAMRLDTLAGAAPAVATTPVRRTETAASAVAFVPRIVIERGASGLSAWLAEFRVVSVVYVRLGESEVHDAAGVEALRAVFDRVAQATEALDVEIFDVVADDKGIIAKIACGIPPFSRENNAARAVEIARRVHQTLLGVRVSCSVGVATGQAFCGDVGNAIRREYVLNGPLMNYGARLMQAADGEVLYDAETVSAARGQFAFTAADPIVVRGRSEPLAVYRLAEPLMAPGLARANAVALQGRDNEIAELTAALDRLRDGQGGLIVLEGEPGTGKSRLLAELCVLARERDCAVVETSTHEIERATPYFAFRRGLEQILRRPGDAVPAPAETLRERLAGVLAGTGLSARLALAEDILPLGMEDPGLASQIGGAARQTGIEDILVALTTDRCSESPLLLVVDDLHWIDGLSADLLLALSRRVPDLLVVAASRPLDPIGAPHAGRVLLRASQRIDLWHLEASSTARIISALLQVPSVPRRLAEFVHGKSEGLPFHAEQLVLSLAQHGLIEVADGRCRVAAADIAAVDVPHRLRDIIVSRIDGLSQTDQLAAKVASVIGRVFEIDALRDIFPVETDEAALAASLRRLAGAGILAPSGSETGTAYAFRHVITQETTYALLSFAQRRPLHRQIAEAIEQRHARALQPYFAELAHHWEQASETSKALDYRLDAADLAIRRYANDDALMHLERAERLAERTNFVLPVPRRVRLAYVRGEAFHALSRFPEAGTHFNTCLELTGIHRPATPVRLAVAVLGQLGRQGLHRFGLLRKSRHPSRRYRAKLSAHVYTRLAEHAYFMNDTGQLMHGTLTALNQAESIGSVAETTQAYGALAIGLGTAGLHEVAGYYRDRSTALADKAGRLADQGTAQLFAMVYSFQAGNWRDAWTYSANGSAIFERLGDRFRHQTCQVVDCYTALATGDFARAAAELDAFGAHAEAIDNAPVRAWALAAMSILDMLQGRPPARTLERMAAARDETLNRAERLLCDGLEAAARLRGGDIDGAERVAARALDSMREDVCTMGIALFSVCAVAEVYLALAERAMRFGTPHEAALQQARAACRAVRQYGGKTRICRPRAHLLTGRLALLNGHRRQAVRQFQRGLTEARGLGMPLEQAMCHLALAEAVGDDAERRHHADKGTARMRDLGADPWAGDTGPEGFVADGIAHEQAAYV